MAFNKQKFIADAKAAGYGDDEINAELADAEKSSSNNAWDTKQSEGSAWDTGQKPMSSASVPERETAPNPGFGKRVDEAVKKTEDKRVEQQQNEPLIPDYAKNPLALAAAGAAGGATVMGWKTLRDKMAGGTAPAPTAPAPVNPAPTAPAPVAQNAPPSQAQVLARLQTLAGETPSGGTQAANEGSMFAGMHPKERAIGSYWDWYDKNYPSAENAPAPVSAPAPAPAAPTPAFVAESVPAPEIAPAPTPTVTPEPVPVAPVVPAAPVAPVQPPPPPQSGETSAEVDAKAAEAQTKADNLKPATTAAPAPSEANAPVVPDAEKAAAAAKAAEEKKTKIPLFSDADKKAFTSEQRSVLQHMQYGQSPEEAKTLLRHFENTLPEGVKLSYGAYPEDVYNEAGKKIKTAGTSKGGFPEPKQNLLNFWNEALGTNHSLNEKGNFDYKPTPEDVTKAHSYWSEKMANATTPAAKSAAEKGFATVGAMAKLAGISLGALGAIHAYKTGKKTGDWSDLGLLGGSLLAGASAPAQIAYQGLTYSKPLGETQEQLNQLGKQLEYAGKVGYGRGLVNPSNAVPPPRHTMTNR